MTTELALPNNSIRDIVSPKGRITGQKFILDGSGMTPAELKQHLRSQGMRGNTLSHTFREVMRGNQTVAWASAQCFMEMCRKEGKVPTVGTNRKNTANLQFVDATEVAKKVKKAEGLDPEVVIANKLGIKVEDLRLMIQAAAEGKPVNGPAK